MSHAEHLERFEPAPRLRSPSYRELMRQELSKDTEEWLSQGNHIAEIPPGASGFRGGSMGIIVNTDKDKPLVRKRSRKAKEVSGANA